MPFPPRLPSSLVPPSRPDKNNPFPSPSQLSLPMPQCPNTQLMQSPSNELASLDFASIIGGPLMAAVNAQAAAAMTTVEFIKKVGFQSPPSEDSSQTGVENNEDPGVMEPIYVTFKYPKEIMPYQPAVPPGLIGITIVKPGKGYTTAPTLNPPSNVTGHTLIAELDGDKVSKIIIKEAGTGWKSGDTITVEAPPQPTSGSATAVETAVLRISVREYQEAKPAIYDTMALQVPILTMLPVPYLRIEQMDLEFDVKIDQTEKVNVATTIGMNAGMGGGLQGNVSGFGAAAKFSASISMQTKGSYSNEINRKYSMNVKVKAVQPEMPEGLARILSILEKSILSQPMSTLLPPATTT